MRNLNKSKKLVVILQSLNKSKKLEVILRTLNTSWMTASWIAAPYPSLCKTLLGETWCLGNPYFTHWLPKHPVFWFNLILTQSVRLPVVTYPLLCSPCVTYGTLCHTIGYQVFPNPAYNVIPHPSVSYRQVFRPILYFQSNSSQGNSRLYPNPYLGKWRISLEVISILSMYLRLHT